MTALLQGSLSGGELSPSLYPRVDLARYQTSVRTGTNFIVRPYGGMVNRPGTQFIGEAQGVTRLIPFQVSSAVAYILELADLEMRFISDGAYIESSPGVTLVVVTPWDEDEIFDLKYTQSADTMYFAHPDFKPRSLRRDTPASFTLAALDIRFGPFEDLNVDSRIQIYASDVTGTVTITSSFAVFAADHVGTLLYLEPRELAAVRPWSQGERWALSDNGIYRRSDGKTYRLGQLETGTDAEFAVSGPWRPVHTSGTAWDGAGIEDHRDDGVQEWYVGVPWEFIDLGFGIVEITAFTNSKSVTARVVSRLPLGVVGGPTGLLNTWNTSGDGVTVTFPIAGATKTAPNNFTVTIATVPVPSESYTSPVDPTQGWRISGTNIVFNNPPANLAAIQIKEYTEVKTTDAWALGAWSEVNGYPSEVEFYADRLVFAGTVAKPQSLWMSQTSDYTNFGKSSPIVDSDAITTTLNARKLNEIRELVPLDALLVLTSGGQWTMKTGTEQIVAPTTVGFKTSGNTSASHVPSLLIDESAIFIQDRGFSVRDLRYTFEVDGFSGNDLTVFANHLTEGKRLVDWTYQKLPYSVVWIVRQDGTLLAFTYMREQEIIAWTPMEMSGGLVESIACIPEGDEDAVYMVVNRTVDGSAVRYVERLSTRLFTDVRECTFLDSFLTFDGRNTGATTMTVSGASYDVGEAVTITASASSFVVGDVGDMIVLGWSDALNVRVRITAYTSATVVTGEIETPMEDLGGIATTDWGFARDTISGLGHLEGETVGILADGFVPDTAVVTAGAITLDDPAVLVHVGLKYTSDLAMLDMQAPGAQSMRMDAKNLKRLGLLVQETRGIWFGPSFERMDEKEPRQDEEYQQPPALQNGRLELYPESGWDPDARIHVQQRDPLPCTVGGVIVADIRIGS